MRLAPCGSGGGGSVANNDTITQAILQLVSALAEAGMPDVEGMTITLPSYGFNVVEREILRGQTPPAGGGFAKMDLHTALGPVTIHRTEGEEHTASVPISCTVCGGSGYSKLMKNKCPSCDGKGLVMVDVNPSIKEVAKKFKFPKPGRVEKMPNRKKTSEW